MKSQKKTQTGITLIALVITIIVLLILAGVSISLVVGNNGVLTEASSAVVVNRKAKAKEEVEMAFASAEAEYMAEWTKDSSKIRGDFFTAENLTKYTGGTEGTGTVLESTANADGTYTVKYQANDQGTEYTFTVDSSGKIVLAGSEAGGSVTPTPTQETLASKAAVGVYVNINVPYNDQLVTVTEGANTVAKPYTTTGWRVLYNNGTTVNLISTGNPLTFYHPAGDAASSITEMNKINTETLTVDESNGRGYRKNGFSTNDVKSLFSNTSVFAGIQPARCSAVGVSITSSTDVSIRKSGGNYWLGEAYHAGALYRVDKWGDFSYGGDFTMGVRPVVTLVSGVTILDGDGSESSPYRLNGITY